MIGGRNLVVEGASIRAAVTIDGRPIDDLVVAPGAFLRFLRLPEGALDGAGRYARISVAADSPRLAIEQFDAQSSGQLMFGFGEGWHELEYNPATGRMWRWMSERGAIRVRGAARSVAIAPTDAHSEQRPQALRLVLTGETDPLPRPSRVTVRAADRVIAEFTVGRTFSVQAVIAGDLLTADENVIVVETDQVVVPAERSRQDAGSPASWLASLRRPAQTGFLARQISELPNGPSKCRSQRLSSSSSAVSRLLIGAAGTEISRGFGCETPPPLHHPQSGEREEQRDVGVGEPHDREAGAGDQALADPIGCSAAPLR